MRTNPRQRALLTRCDAFEGAVDQIRQWRVPLHGCDAWLDGGYPREARAQAPPPGLASNAKRQARMPAAPYSPAR
jgi:hypothetical protein